MSDLDSIRACIGKIQAIKKQNDSLWAIAKNARFYTTVKSRFLSLVDRYNETQSWINSSYPEIGFLMPIVSISSDVSQYAHFVEPYLQDITIGCQTAESGLERKLTPKVESEIIDRLDSIRNELRNFEDKGLDLGLIKNIKTAIEEAEQGHYLASAMISSRAIAYISDQIEGNNDKEKVDYLVAKGIISKERKDDQGQLMRSMRLSRNFFSHRIDVFSDSANVLMLIGGSIDLSKILISLESV